MKKMQRKDGMSYKITFVHPITKKWASKTVRCSYKDALKIKADIEKDLAFGKRMKSKGMGSEKIGGNRVYVGIDINNQD
jgi:hypothetical protein